MDRTAWFAMMRAEHISVRFAKEIESNFGEYPGISIVETLWDSDWGRGCAEHFGIENLRVPDHAGHVEAISDRERLWFGLTGPFIYKIHGDETKRLGEAGDPHVEHWVVVDVHAVNNVEYVRRSLDTH